MHITVNGKLFIASDDLTIEQLLDKHNLTDNPLVVEVNKVIVPRENYGLHCLATDDIVEILRFVGGG
jgi:sulfur carrier protein